MGSLAGSLAGVLQEFGRSLVGVWWELCRTLRLVRSSVGVLQESCRSLEGVWKEFGGSLVGVW